jgi:rhodanese-related sulfurtransferase
MSEDIETLGFKIGQIRHLSPTEAHMAAKLGAIFVDVRLEYEPKFKAFDVEKIIYIPHDKIKTRYHELPQDEYLVIADSVGLHSKEVVEFLLAKEFSMIANLNGGICDWERDGLPMMIDVNERLSGSCACMLKPREKTSNNKK